LCLARRHAEVTVLARNRERLAALVAELLECGAPAARALVADLDDRDAAEALVSRHIEEHGPVHVLVNNTGGPPSGPLLDADDAAFLMAFGRHVLAAHRLVRRALPGMRAAAYGRIVNVVSTSVREPIDGLGVSNTIRAAVAGWAKSLSRELPPGVTINNVLPGFTATERLDTLSKQMAARAGVSPDAVVAGWLSGVPEGRLADPTEIGEIISFLASPEAAYVRGASIQVDGGRMRGI
jgi:3-oxoacyl-[acyl-carrier protein] reductase